MGAWSAALLPAAFFVVAVALIGWSWWQARSENARIVQLETRVTSEQVKARLDAWFASRAVTLTKLSRDWPRWGAGIPADRDRRVSVFREEAGQLLALYPGFQAINWVDATGHIEVVVPARTNEGARGANLHLHPEATVRENLRIALETGQQRRTGVIELLQGGVGFAVYQRVGGDDGPVQGAINGVFRLDESIDACLPEPQLRESFRFALFDESGRAAYSSVGLDEGPPADWPEVHTLDVSVIDRNMRLHVAPSQAHLARVYSSTDDTLLVAGLLLALIGAIALRGYLKGYSETQESEARYRLLVENQSDLIVKLDRDGRFVFVSPSFCKTFGHSEQELLGQSCLVMVPEGEREDLSRRLEGFFESPRSAVNEHQVLTRQGWRWYSWSTAPAVDESGQTEGILAVGRDVTDHKRLEEQLRQSQKVEAIGQLAGGVAHDFNNLLQVILGHAELSYDDPEDLASTRNSLEAIMKSARKGASLTQQLLAFSRRQRMSFESADLGEVLGEMIQMIRRTIDERIEIVFEPAEGLPPARIDPRQVEQVLLNLCLNARDAMPDGGRLLVETFLGHADSTTRESAPWVTPGPLVGIRVSDTGHGMDRETLDRAFEPFFTTKAVGEGTGLGLSSVYGIVRQHKGVIRATSEPGQGASIEVLFPAAPRDEAGEA